jgi:hypothetical protein
MMTGLDNTGCCVQVHIILVGSGVAKEDTHEIVEIELAVTRTGMFDTHPRSECFEVCNVGFLSKPAFKWSDTGGRVYKVVV